MISVSEAKILVVNSVATLNSKNLALKEALGKILSEDIISPVNLPPFPQSAMDGYALKFGTEKVYKVIGEIAAGNMFSEKMENGTAVRIFTGACVPEDADAVIMQEKVTREGDRITIDDSSLKAGSNIRKVGTQIEKNTVALKSGTKLNPGSIGFIASMGISSVKVYPHPRVSILVTGNELQKSDEKLSQGKIFESNSIMLESALKQIGITDVTTHYAKDNENEIVSLLKSILADSDIIILSGGISVGDYDFAENSMKMVGVKTVFYKVKQKPGKPLFFGMKKEVPFFALPGNPAAALTCFYEYVYPAIRKMSGHEKYFLEETKAISKSAFEKKAGLTNFLKSNFKNGEVEILEGQESYKINSFAEANSFVVVEEETEKINVGDNVTVHLLPAN